jgi:hypothetical protein
LAGNGSGWAALQARAVQFERTLVDRGRRCCRHAPRWHGYAGYAALATSLDCLSQRTEKPEIGIASLAQSVESLDQRIVAMQNLVSDVASIFTSDRQH